MSNSRPPKKKDGMTSNDLGLAVVKEILAYHGGNIWAESKIDFGSSFYFSLPIYKNN